MMPFASCLRALVLAATCGCSVLAPLAAAGAQGPQMPGGGGRWTLVFSDEFNGSSLDKSKWTTCYWWADDGCTNLGNRELQWYLRANVRVSNGHLHLIAQRQKVRGIRSRTFHYTSGMVTTGASHPSRTTRFEFQYGFAEMRAKIPAGKGLHPAFWMLPAGQHENPEVDIMEVLGQSPRTLHTYLHYLDKSGREHRVGGPHHTGDLSAGWAVYGLEWQRGRLSWYLNGKEIWRDDNPAHIPSEPMYLLVNLAVGGNWPGKPSSATVFPAEMVVDYVRVWQQK